MSFPAPPGFGAGPALPPAPAGVGLLGAPPRGPLPPVDVLVVPYAYDRITGDARQLKRVLIIRIISLAVTVAILVGIQVWRRVAEVESPAFGWPYLVVLSVSLGVSVGFLAWAVLQFLRARQRVRALRPEPIMIIARPGIELAGQQVSWSSVAGLQARTQLGGDVFLVHRTDGPPLQLPFTLIDAAPSSLDSAARAFSGGRFGVDFAQMDN